MQINNNFKIYTPKYHYVINNHPEKKPAKPTKESVCLKDTPNLYYQPIFTGQEMSDTEYRNKVGFLESKFLKSSGNAVLNNIFSVLNKENINLATTLLTDKSINQLKLQNYLADILEHSTAENSSFTEKLCREAQIPPKSISGIISFVNEKSLPFAELLYKEDFSPMTICDILYRYEEDIYRGFGNYLAEKYEEKADSTTVFNHLAQISDSKEVTNNLKLFQKIYENPELDLQNKYIFKLVCNNNLPLLKNLYNKIESNTFSIESSNVATQLQYFNYLRENFTNTNLPEIFKKIEHQQELVLKHPKKYVNGYEPITKETGELLVNSFFSKNYTNIMLFASIFDKEALDYLFRKRFDNVFDILTESSKLTPEEITTLRKMVNSLSNQGKPLLPSQQFDCLKFIKEYHRYEIPLDKINTMVENNSIDFSEIYKDIFKQTLLKTGLFTQSELETVPLKNLVSWDIAYTHLLSEELNKMNSDLPVKGLKDTIYEATKGNFKTYISSPSSLYGSINYNTEKLFNIYKLNYNKWLSPSPQNNIIYTNINTENEFLAQQANKFSENIENLRNIDPNLKKYIDKILAKYIKNGNFIIDEKIVHNSKDLEKQLNHIINQLNKVWNRASINLLKRDQTTSLSVLHKVTGTLLIKENLDEILKKINNSNTNEENPEVNLTIKMWDRIPQKDLFQGNYSTCCIGMGKGNGSAMPYYLLNTSFNMIEIKDNNTGNVIGNALCYWANDNRGIPSLIIDNIEISYNNISKFSNNDNLLNAITQYAKNIVKEVSPNPNSKIYLGTQHNDLTPSDINIENNYINFIGDISCDKIYLDVYGGWILKDRNLYNQSTVLYELSANN